MLVNLNDGQHADNVRRPQAGTARAHFLKCMAGQMLMRSGNLGCRNPIGTSKRSRNLRHTQSAKAYRNHQCDWGKQSIFRS
jgi:hypothetical protein